MNDYELIAAYENDPVRWRKEVLDTYLPRAKDLIARLTKTAQAIWSEPLDRDDVLRSALPSAEMLLCTRLCEDVLVKCLPPEKAVERITKLAWLDTVRALSRSRRGRAITLEVRTAPAIPPMERSY